VLERAAYYDILRRHIDLNIATKFKGRTRLHTGIQISAR